jgi:hypothetical protein
MFCESQRASFRAALAQAGNASVPRAGWRVKRGSRAFFVRPLNHWENSIAIEKTGTLRSRLGTAVNASTVRSKTLYLAEART